MEAGRTLTLEDVQKLPESSETERGRGLPHLLDDGEHSPHSQPHHLLCIHESTLGIYSISKSLMYTSMDAIEGESECVLKCILYMDSANWMPNREDQR